MKTIGFVAAVAALGVSSAAQAQDAGAAFGCGLPYRDTMMALGSLKVTGQRAIQPFPGLSGGGEHIEFAPGETRVLGATPQALVLEVEQPAELASRKLYKVSLLSQFAPTTTNDEAIKASTPWHFGVCGSYCLRAEAAQKEGLGELGYRRNENPLKVECIFRFTPEEFEALGE